MRASPCQGCSDTERVKAETGNPTTTRAREVVLITRFCKDAAPPRAVSKLHAAANRVATQGVRAGFVEFPAVQAEAERCVWLDRLRCRHFQSRDGADVKDARVDVD